MNRRSERWARVVVRAIDFPSKEKIEDKEKEPKIIELMTSELTLILVTVWAVGVFFGYYWAIKSHDIPFFG